MPDPAPCTVRWAAPIAPEDAPGLVALLDAHERDRLARFRRPADGARYLAAHALARVLLGELLDVAPAAVRLDRTCRCGQQHGKPAVRPSGPPSPDFSLTHAGDLVGVAVRADGQVGLDVERIRELGDLPGMAAHVASPTEPRPLVPPAFFAAWTRKEALLKATGIGLSAPMTAITLHGTRLVAWSGEHAPSGPMWLRDLQPVPGYAAAVAGDGPLAPPMVELRGDHLLRSAARRSGQGHRHDQRHRR